MSKPGLVIDRETNNIGFLRLFAAALVLVNHSYDLLEVPGQEILTRLTHGSMSLSKLGLIIFFVSSGLLITKSLYNSPTLKNFLWKRILRIYPALIIVVFLTALVLGPIVTKYPIREYFGSRQVWEYLFGATLVRLRFYLPGVFNHHGVNGSLWTLPVEFRLYLFAALLFIFGVLKNYKKLIIVILLLWLIWVFHSRLVPDSKYVYWGGYVTWGAYFFTGSLAYLCKDHLRVSPWVVLILFVLWLFLMHSPYIGLMTELLFFSYLVLFMSFKLPLVAKRFFLQNDLSYSLYLFAYPIQQLIIYKASGQILSPFMLTLISSLVLVPICFASWNLIEKPCLKLKTKII